MAVIEPHDHVIAPRPAPPPKNVRGMGRSLRRRPELVLSPLGLVVVLVLWTWTSETGVVPRIILPPPAEVAQSFLALVTAPWFPQHLLTTATEMVLGFLIASGVAIVLAILLAHMPLARRTVYPYIVIFQVMPMIALAPVIVIWLGFGIQSKVFIAVTTAFFVVLVNSLAGFEAVRRNALLLMTSLAASRRQVFLMLTLPSALPYIFAGLKTATTMALIGALVGEFVTAQAGLGRLLTQFSFAIEQDYLFATVLVIAGLGLAMYGLVGLAQRRIVWWRA